MAGITDLPFRTVALRLGAGLVVSEMVASAEVVRGAPRRAGAGRARRSATLERRSSSPAASRAAMAEAARWCAGQGARIIDINFGCPAKKVTNGLSGSALMREPDLALRLIEAVVAAPSTVPVTVKMRLGWDAGSDERPGDRGAGRERPGSAMVTVHGRTRCQFYDGHRRLGGDRGGQARRCAIPVIANGDIASLADARRALALSGADGVMIGRARAAGHGSSAQIAAGARRPAAARGAHRGAALAALVSDHYARSVALLRPRPRGAGGAQACRLVSRPRPRHRRRSGRGCSRSPTRGGRAALRDEFADLASHGGAA